MTFEGVIWATGKFVIFGSQGNHADLAKFQIDFQTETINIVSE